MTVIGFIGSISSGKNTAAEELVGNYGFQQISFADSLKTAVSAVFSWDKTLLDGNTTESRKWREEVDNWWSERLNMPGLTPRKVLQLWGTDVVRNHFHGELWVASVERKLAASNSHIVISDVRFPNEIAAIRRAGGKLIQVQRGALPPWYSTAMQDLQEGTFSNAASRMAKLYPEIHYSEWAWIAENPDFILYNNGTLAELKSNLKLILTNLELDSPKSI